MIGHFGEGQADDAKLSTTTQRDPKYSTPYFVSIVQSDNNSTPPSTYRLFDHFDLFVICLVHLPGAVSARASSS